MRTYRTVSVPYAKLAFAAALLVTLDFFGGPGVRSAVHTNTGLAVAAPVGLLVLGDLIYTCLSVRNCQAIVSDTGVTVVNWLRWGTFVPYENLLSLVQQEVGGRPLVRRTARGNGRLTATVDDGVGHLRRVRIATYEGSCPRVVAKLRDDVIGRRGLQFVPPVLHTRGQRLWQGFGFVRERTWS
jgi:hypothetical protein